VAARSIGTGFELSVSNLGELIPPDAVPLLFQPFTRATNGGKDGLGLGLYIASEIAKAHGGALEVESTSSVTIYRPTS
jgi:sigma-B regulation protein RsbU (phosphoserine phosphatase)